MGTGRTDESGRYYSQVEKQGLFWWLRVYDRRRGETVWRSRHLSEKGGWQHADRMIPRLARTNTRRRVTGR